MSGHGPWVLRQDKRGKFHLVPKHRAVPKGQPQSAALWADLPPYKSPLGTGTIEGRSARREDLKRANCREVDPSEFKAVYRNPEFCAKHGLPLGGDPLPRPQRMPTTIGPDVR